MTTAGSPATGDLAVHVSHVQCLCNLNHIPARYPAILYNMTSDSEYAGIDGLLLLPAISFIAVPMILISILFNNVAMLNNPALNIICGFYPGFEMSVLMQTFIVSIQLAFMMYAAFLFFRKKRALLKIMVAMLTIHMLTAVGNIYWICFFYNEFNLLEYSGVIGAISMAGFCIPYFLKSRRVRLTFVNV